MKFNYMLLIFMVFQHFLSCAPIPPHIRESNRIIDEFSNEIAKEGFTAFGTGGAFCGGINEFNLTYILPSNSINIDQARVLLIHQTEKFLKKVNSDSKVKEYLTHNPYDEKNIMFRIRFKPLDDSIISSSNIATSAVFKGKVKYSIDDGRLFKNVYTETCAEAYQKVYGRPLPARGNDAECK